jgi:hypothetical protein
MTIFGERVRLRVLLIVVAMALAGIPLYRVGNFFGHMGPSTGQVESWITTELPANASEAQVDELFNRHGVDYRRDARSLATGNIVWIEIHENRLSLFTDCTLVVRFDFGLERLTQAHQTSEECISL